MRLNELNGGELGAVLQSVRFSRLRSLIKRFNQLVWKSNDTELQLNGKQMGAGCT
jgi:hypothetical protein